MGREHECHTLGSISVERDEDVVGHTKRHSYEGRKLLKKKKGGPTKDRARKGLKN